MQERPRKCRIVCLQWCFLWDFTILRGGIPNELGILRDRMVVAKHKHIATTSATELLNLAMSGIVEDDSRSV